MSEQTEKIFIHPNRSIPSHSDNSSIVKCGEGQTENRLGRRVF